MKKFRVSVALILVAALMLSTGSVFAASTGYSKISDGYYGYYLDKTVDASVSDGVLTVTQNADQVYNYPDSTANFFVNSGFEKSDSVVHNSTTGLKEITAGWATYKTKDILDLEMSTDAHSGSKALKMTILSGNQGIFNYYSEGMQYKNLEADQQYIMSFWVKGDATPRIQYKDRDHTGATRTVVSGVNTQNWVLATQIVTADSDKKVEQLVINLNSTTPSEQTNKYIIVDDIQFMTVSNAEAMVKQMIADLDIESPTAARAIDDIEQWCAKLSLTKTDEYADFEVKKAEYDALVNPCYKVEYVNNMYNNSGFELSDTDCIGWVVPNTNDIVSIETNDVHSGNNALKYTATATSAGESVVYNTENSAIQVEKGEYILSAWVKGNSARFFNRNALNSSSYNSETETVSVTLKGANRSGSYNNFYNDWTLMTHSFSPMEVTVTTDEALGTTLTTYWMTTALTINPPNVEGAYTLVDDVALMKKSDAIANVEAMIVKLDMSAANASRLVSDINQWVAVLGADNISNYDLFELKQAGGYLYYNNANLVKNAGFELSTSESATKDWVLASGDYSSTISSDAHSGDNAISFTGATGEKRLDNVFSPDTYTQVSSNEEYIVSMWTKGGTAARLMFWTYNGSSWSSASREGNRREENDWTLVTQKLTPVDYSEKKVIRWAISVNAEETTDNVMVDDVMVIKTSEAKAMVKEMIAKLDVKSDYYARACEDIKQWVAKLDDAELTALYEEKLAECNAIADDMTNIITPNQGFDKGEYLASVSLKGKGEVGILFHQMGGTFELTDEWTTYSECISVAEDETAIFGVQLMDTTDVVTTQIKDFSLVKLESGDANFDLKVNIRDLVRTYKYVNDDTVTISGVADMDSNGVIDKADLEALRNLLIQD